MADLTDHGRKYAWKDDDDDCGDDDDDGDDLLFHIVSSLRGIQKGSGHDGEQRPT